VGAFRGTGDSLMNRMLGSVEEEEDYEKPAISGRAAVSEELAVSEDWDIDEPMVHLFHSLLCWLMKYFQRSVGMTPPFQEVGPLEMWALDAVELRSPP